MEIRTLWSKVVFPRPFALPGSESLFPAGEYDLLVEEERLQGLTFDAYRRTSAFLQITDNPRFPGRTELRPVSEADLQQALGSEPIMSDPPDPVAHAENVPRKETT